MTDTLEERTKNRLKMIGNLINSANEFAEHRDDVEATYYQTLAIHGQNEIIIEYQQEIYKMLKGKNK